MTAEPKNIVDKSSKILRQLWEEIKALAQKGQLRDYLDDKVLVGDISRLINSTSKTYRYVLPTQILAKFANPSLDARCLQAQRKGKGAFDARTIAHKIIVPFDQENNNVLGGSTEPYVNNPLRVPEISSKYRNQQKNVKDWDIMSGFLQFIENQNNPKLTEDVFRQILVEIYRRLTGVKITYPAPLRVSYDKSIKIMEEFISSPSGGDRLLAVSAALFMIVGRRFGIFDDVKRGKITASDRSMGMIADLECVTSENEITMAVEVKDRELTINQIRSKMPKMREKQISEIFFIAQQGIAISDKVSIDHLVTREFTGGHNIYITDIMSLGKTLLAIFGEEGRRMFLREVGIQLNKFDSDAVSRQEWVNLLRVI